MRIDIADPVSGFFWRASAEVECDLWASADEFAEAEKFVGAKRVVFRNAPGDISHADALFARTNRVTPVVCRREISAESNNGRLHRLGHRNHFGVHAIDAIRRE